MRIDLISVNCAHSREELWSARIIFASAKATATLVNPRAQLHHPIRWSRFFILSLFAICPALTPLCCVVSSKIILRLFANNSWYSLSKFDSSYEYNNVTFNMYYLRFATRICKRYLLNQTQARINAKINEICMFMYHATCR